MRVALVCPYSLSMPGGVQGQVLGLADALAARGLCTAVVAPMDDGGAPGAGGAGAPPRFSVGRSRRVPANGSVAPLALDPAAWTRTVGALRRWRPDVVHVHEPLAPLVGWAVLAGRVPGARRVGTLHRAGGAGLYRLAAPLARSALGHLDAVVAVSAAARDTAAAALGGRSCPVVGNGVDLDRFAGAERAPTAGPTVVFVGRHERRKGLGVLLAAVSRLEPAERPTVWITSDGPETARLQARYPGSPRLRWLGRVPDDELARLLLGADVLCAPALGGESFGVVLVEAMVARCVVVASAIPGYEEVLGGHGLTVPPGDEVALAAALRRALAAVAGGTGPAAPDALQAAADRARTFALPALAERYHQLYEEVRTLPGYG